MTVFPKDILQVQAMDCDGEEKVVPHRDKWPTTSGTGSFLDDCYPVGLNGFQ